MAVEKLPVSRGCQSACPYSTRGSRQAELRAFGRCARCLRLLHHAGWGGPATAGGPPPPCLPAWGLGALGGICVDSQPFRIAVGGPAA